MMALGTFAWLITSVGCGGSDASRIASQSANDPANAAPNNAVPNNAAQPPANPAPAQPPAAENPPAETPSAETPSAETEESKKKARGIFAQKPKPEDKEEEPALPEDVTQWKPADFRTAKAENDRKLKEAIEHLGETSVGDEKAAQLLIELLEVPKPEEPSEEAAGGQRPRSVGRGGSAGQNAVVIIEALGKNKTTLSRETLAKVITGEFDTGARGQTVVKQALEALVDDDSPHAEELLIVMLLSDQPIAVDEGQNGAQGRETLRKAILAAVREKPVLQLRSRLTDMVMAADTAAEVKKQYLVFLSESRPENLPSQVKLYLHPATDAKLKQQFELQMMGYSFDAMDQLLGIPEEARAKLPGVRLPGLSGASRSRVRRGQESTEPDPTMHYLVVEQLWQASLIDAVEEKAKAVEEWEDAVPTIMLGSSLPIHRVRHELFNLLKDNWDEGTDELKVGGPFGATIRDPGLLLVVKAAPRKEDPSKKNSSSSSNPRRPTPPRAPRVSDSDKARFAWMDASEEFVKVLNEKFLAAALARAEANPLDATESGSETDEAGTTANSDDAATEDEADSDAPAAEEGESDTADSPTDAADADENSADPADDASAAPETGASAGDIDPEAGADKDPFGTRHKAAETSAESSDELPLELHDSDQLNVVAKYKLNWPADLEGHVSGVEITPMIIHYLRLEDVSRVSKVAAFYERQLSTARKRTIDDGIWIDAAQTGMKPTWRRSVDIMVHEKNPSDDDEKSSSSSGRRVEDEPLVIEILTIEIPDPRKSDKE
jgi:hypothetical protein